MTISLIEIEQQASMLPPDDRAKLAEFLLESLQQPMLAEIEQAWEQEIACRVAAFESGEVSTISAEDVFAETKSLLQ